MILDGNVLDGKLFAYIRQYFSYQLQYLCIEVLLSLLGKYHAPDYSLFCLILLLDAEVNDPALTIQKATNGLLYFLLLGRGLVLIANEWKVVVFVLNAEALWLIDYLIF